MINVPLSCVFKEKILNIIHSEKDRLERERSNLLSNIRNTGADFYAEVDDVSEMIDTINGYQNIIEKEPCVE